MLEVAQPWEPRFAPRETVPETVRCLLSRKPTRLKYKDVGQQQHCPRVLSSGARGAVAQCDGARAAATTQSADEEGQEHVGG